MLNVMEIAKMELDNKVDETISLIESKIAEVIKSSQPSDFTITRSDINVYNIKMFTRICEKVSEECPEGIKVSIETTSRGGELIRVKVDYKELF